MELFSIYVIEQQLDILLGEAGALCREVGDVIRAEVPVIHLWVGLWQDERLGEVKAAIFLDVRKMYAAVLSVGPFRGKSQPAAVVAPGVVGAVLVRVDDGVARVVEVDEAERSLLVPDGERAIVRAREAEVATVRRALREVGRALSQACIVERIDLVAERSVLRVEAEPAQRILQLADRIEQVARRRDGVAAGVRRRTIDDGASVGREAREGLERLRRIACHLWQEHLIVVEVCDAEVRHRIIDLQAMALEGMECRDDDVAREDGILTRRVPVTIDGAALHVGRLERHLAELAVAVEDGAALLAAQVEEAVLPLVAAVDVAVHAAVAQLVAVGEVARLEALGAALLDRDVVPHLIARLDESIGDEGVDAVGRHAPRERGILPPLAVLLCGDGDGGIAALIYINNVFPAALGEDDLVAAAFLLIAVSALPACDLYLHGVIAAAQHEVERCDVAGQGDVLVVRIHGEGILRGLHVVRGRGAGG